MNRGKVIRYSRESRDPDASIDKVRLIEEEKILLVVIVEDPLRNTVMIEDCSVS